MAICQYVLKALKMDVVSPVLTKTLTEVNTILSNLHVLTHLIRTTTCYYPHIQMRKLRPR